MTVMTSTPTLGDAVQARLAQLKISKSELARRLEVDPSYISRIVSGERIPALDMLKKLAKTINVKWQDLAALTPEVDVEVKSTPKINTAYGKENTLSKKPQGLTVVSAAKFNTLRQINPSLKFVDVDDEGGVIVNTADLQFAVSTPGGNVSLAKQATLDAIGAPVVFADTKSTCHIENAKRYSKATKKWEDSTRLFKVAHSTKKEMNFTLKNDAFRIAYETGASEYQRYDGLCTYWWDEKTDELTIFVGGTDEQNIRFKAILSRKAVAKHPNAEILLVAPVKK